MAKRGPTPIDRQIGARVRMRRLALGLSQGKLAAALGITFQQLQKYEKGTNRLGAGRLPEVARALQVSIDYFFEGVAAVRRKQAPPADVSDLRTTADGLALSKAFGKIRDARLRRCIVCLVEATTR